MKIGVITYFGGTNYGTALQAFALCSFLRASGHDAEIVRYYDDSLIFQNEGRNVFSAAKIKSRIATEVYNLVEKKHKEETIKVFRLFRDEHIPHSKEFYNSNNIVNSVEQYDCFICGSDQIWTPWNGGIDPVYWLSFVNNDRCKIAYAPSISNTNFSEKAKDAISKYCASFQSISVREGIGEQFLSQLGIYNVEKVLDPTLLLDDLWWSSAVMGGGFSVNYLRSIF